MRKLSLSRVLSETMLKLEDMEELGRRRLAEQDADGDGLEDFSAELEGEDGEAQKAATSAMPQNVQQVWGGPSLGDEDLTANDNNIPDKTVETLSRDYNLTPDDLQRIKGGDFSTVINKIGDPHSFAEDVSDVFGGLIAQKINDYIPQLQANPVQSPTAPKLTLANAAKKADLNFKSNQVGNSALPTRDQFSGTPQPTAAPPSQPARNVPMAHEPTVFSSPQVKNPTKTAPMSLGPPTNPGIRKPRRP